MNEKEMANLIESIHVIMNDAGKFSDELKQARNGIGRLQQTLLELDDYARRIQKNVSNAVERLQSFRDLSGSGLSNEAFPNEDETKSGAKNRMKEDAGLLRPDIEKKSSSRTDSTKPVGIMIFICPEGEDNDHQIGDSTCITRRQLVPTSQEEKMILDYLINNGHKPNQKEYNRVYREISTMLIKAPKNAVAIELRVGKSNEKLKTVEIFYHVKVKDSIQFADFRYVRYKGVDAYRVKNSAAV